MPEYTAVRKLECNDCGHRASKVIYAGMPAKLCMNRSCSLLWGFWSFFIALLPYNGYMWVYEGSYFKGLWAWMWDEGERE